MTVKMSSEGDSSKNLASEGKEKSETENSNSTPQAKDVKDGKAEKAAENNVEKKDEVDKPNKEVPKEEDKKSENDCKEGAEKADDAKNDVKASADKKEEKSELKEKEKDKQKDKKEDTENSEDKDEDGSDKDDNDEEEEESEKKKPLLDQPLEKSGKRERKNVQRFNEEVKESKESTKVEIPNGSGTPLGNIPRIDASISRFKNDDMKLLHGILFHTPGKSTMVKKNIKLFCGFDFKKNSDEYNKKVASMKKSELKQLKSVCEMLDLMKNGSKDDIIERILDFLIEPKDSGKGAGGGRPKRTAAVRANNRGYSSHDNYSSDERHSGRTTRDKGKRSNLKEDSSSASDEDFEPSDEGSDEKPRVTKKRRVERKKVDSEDEDVSDVDSPSSEESDDEPKNKRKKTTKANNKTKGKGAKRGRKPAAAKKPAKGGKKKNKESSEEEDEEEEESEHKEEEGSSSEDEPLAKKAKTAQFPTDDEIKSYVKEILEGANLEQITMKTVCQQVYAHYPDFDLAHKKDFIKSTVKSLIST